MSAALPACLIEAVFYLGSIFYETRLGFATLASRRVQGFLLWASALLPYLIFSLAAGTFRIEAFRILALLTGVLACWFVLVPRRLAYDAGFLALAAAPILLRVFPRIYLAPLTTPQPELHIDLLGHLMWIRVAMLALLVLREWDPGEFGLWPRPTEWRIGVLYYLAAIVPIALLAVGLHDVRFAPRAGEWWQVAGVAIGTFFGMLWIVAISEELLFRGVIERALLNGWNSKFAAVCVSAVLFGGAHL